MRVVAALQLGRRGSHARPRARLTRPTHTGAVGTGGGSKDADIMPDIALLIGCGAATGVALALLVAHPLSRLAATVVMHRLPYVRADDSAKSAAVARPLAPAELALAAACGLLPLLLLPPAGAFCALLAAMVATTWTARLFLRRLGGYTGDLLGATQQAS